MCVLRLVSLKYGKKFASENISHAANVIDNIFMTAHICFEIKGFTEGAPAFPIF